MQKIRTKDEARQWVLDLCERARVKREGCDLAVIVRDQRRLYWEFAIAYGAALNGLVAMHRVGLIDDQMYNRLRPHVMQLVRPTVLDGLGVASAPDLRQMSLI